MLQGPPPELDGVTHRYVDLSGARLHVAEAGEGPPLVLLHGWPYELSGFAADTLTLLDALSSIGSS